MAAGPGAEGRAGGFEQAEWDLDCKAPRRPSRPSLLGPHSRPLPPGNPRSDPRLPAPSPSRLERGGGDGREAQTRPAASRAWGGSEGAGARRPPLARQAPGVQPPSPPTAPGPEKMVLGQARPPAAFPCALTTPKTEAPPARHHTPPGPLELIKVAKFGGPRERPRARRISEGPGQVPEEGAASDNPPRPRPTVGPRPHLGSPRLCAPLPPRLRGSLAAPPGCGHARRPAPASSHIPLPRPVAACLPHVTREQLRPESPGRRGEGRAPRPAKAMWPLPRRRRPPLSRRKATEDRTSGCLGPFWRPSPHTTSDRESGTERRLVVSGSGKRRKRVPAKQG